MERNEHRSRRRLRDVGLVMGGGALLYVVMVACSGGSGSQAGHDASIGDALMDLLSPNNDANAQSNPTVVTATCGSPNASGNSYATASFPGKTVDQLAAVYALVQSAVALPEGATHYVSSQGLLLKPGAVMFPCGGPGGPETVASIKFFLP